MSLKSLFRTLPLLQPILRKLNMQYERDDFVKSEIQSIEPGAIFLDAGCGSQRYRSSCDHLTYKGQDFGEYTVDDRKVLGSEGVGGLDGYGYGSLDYKGDIWDIDESDDYFDAILCTEVFEHIPYPIETVMEFSRIIKPGGKLILTAPNACLRHMDPYFFYTGFSDNWYKKILEGAGFEVKFLEPVGDYYHFMSVEVARTAESHSILAKILLAPAFLYYFFKKKTPISIDTLCGGYHVVAIKKQVSPADKN
jgi:SAM-dependent methyltransferase